MNKYFVKTKAGLVLACLAGMCTTAVFADGVSEKLQVNFIPQPLGLDAVNVNNLRFSWRISDGMQTAYQIQLSNGWDSGRVESNQQNSIRYVGPALTSKTAYTWKVKCWINGKETDWIQSGFETAILASKDWNGSWVASGGKDEKTKSNLFRQCFQLPQDKKVIKARVYAAADRPRLCFWGFRINGVSPMDNTPMREGMYTFDITDHLKPGKNSLGAMFGGKDAAVKFIGELVIWFDDGSQMTVATGAETKRTRGGPLLEASEFDGEKYDARNEISWSEPSFDDSGWTSCQVSGGVKPETAVLDVVRTIELIKPVSVNEPKLGTYVFDAGTQISGLQVLKINAPAGKEIQFMFAERLNSDGTIDRSTILEGLPAQQIDLYISKKGEQTWSPELTMHGFRYMEVTGLPEKPTSDTIRFRRMAADVVAEKASFECSNESLNRIHQAFSDTEIANAVFDQTDCNQRGERAPWTADAFCVSEASMSYFDMPYFWQEKWINQAIKKVGPHGESNSILTSPGGGFRLLWGSHAVRIPWDYWVAYGDSVYQEGAYQRAKQFADCCINWYDPLDEPVCETNDRKQPARIIEKGTRQDWLIEAEKPWRTVDGKTIENPFLKHGDWVRPDGKWMERTSFINSATYYLCVKRTAEMAQALGRQNEAGHYAEIAENIRNAINAKWLVEQNGKTFYLDNDQTPNSMALDYGIVPDKKRAAVTESLVEHIRSQGNHISTGASGTLSLIPALSKNGRDDVVFDLAVQKTLPSWIGMLDVGPGTFWEHWVEKDMSKCHPFLAGSISAWLHQVVAGIKPLKPGYEEIEIRPVPVGDLTFCKATILTVRGPVGTDWKIEKNMFTLMISVPGNTTAQVYLPGESKPRKTGPGVHRFKNKMK